MAGKRVRVTSETSSGRNVGFHDNQKGIDMSRAQFVREIEHGTYDSYHVRVINGVKTPVSNPDGKSGNNLG